jgi:hypothetical protein
MMPNDARLVGGLVVVSVLLVLFLAIAVVSIGGRGDDDEYVQ